MKNPEKKPYLTKTSLRWRLVWWDSEGHKRRFFKTRGQAMREKNFLMKEWKICGKIARSFSIKERREAAAAFVICKRYGVSLLTMVQEWQERKIHSESPTVLEAAQVFLLHKAKTVSKNYLLDLRIHIVRFSTGLAEKNISCIAAEHIQEMLDAQILYGLSPYTVRNFLRAVSGLLAFCLHRGWVATNVAALIASHACK